MVSAVLNYGQSIWNPNKLNINKIPKSPPYTPIAWEEFCKLVSSARMFDAEANQPDCEDAEKAKWFKAMQKRMEQIEKKLDKLAKNIQQV